MCNKCNSKPCCCSEKRINSQGERGPRGLTGQSAYVYIGYASNVTPGTPDVVTGFSTTTPGCWLAVKSSSIPLTPSQSIFQGLWKKVCGDSALSTVIQSQSFDIVTINSVNNNFNTDVPNGTSFIIGTSGLYMIFAEMNFMKAYTPTADYLSGNSYFSICKNGSRLRYSTQGFGNLIATNEFAPTVFALGTLNAGDEISGRIGLFNPADPGEYLSNFELLDRQSLLVAIKLS